MSPPLTALLALAAVAAPPPPSPRPSTKAELVERYPWLSPDAPVRPLDQAFPAPEGFRRVALPAASFGAWLRGLPLRPAGAQVRDYRGGVVEAATKESVAAVAELDVGRRDLQQCADSIIRLHAEFLRSAGRSAEIAYRFTSGDEAAWTRFSGGDRARVRGNEVTWARSAAPRDDRATFREYLDLVFTYAGTASLGASLLAVARGELGPGDLLVQGGFPGHVVLLLDVAQDAAGRRVALVGQGYTPAQDFHVLARGGDAWFPLEEASLRTPFWRPFPWSAARRFKAR